MAVRIVEVGPRDGLQNIKTTIDASIKLELIQRLQRAGLNRIELTSVVSPKAVPQLADCREILSASVIADWLRSRPSLHLPVLVPNIKGLRVALEHGVKEVSVFVSASEGFSRANLNCSVEEGVQRAREVAREAIASGIAVRGWASQFLCFSTLFLVWFRADSNGFLDRYVSCIFADPVDGPTPSSAVYRAVHDLINMGCYEVSLGDTLGVGTAPDVRRLVDYLKSHGIDPETLAGHFHDTYGQALANVWTAYECGLRTFDSSVGGLGGCPFAPGAKGNVATEDILYLFRQAGIDTGVDLDQVVDIGVWISRVLSKPNDSRAGAALASKAAASSRTTTETTTASAVKVATEPETTLEWRTLRDTDNIRVCRAGTNGNIVLNAVRNGNTLTFPMISDITAAFQSFKDDPSISRIVLSANGKFFCTGMDLSQAARAVGRGDDASTKLYQALTGLFELVDSSPKVTIACINGPAFGGGIGLAFACDIRISISSATFTLSEVKLGLCPAVISRYVVREWGLGLSREAMLTARPVSARELKAMGAISLVAETSRELEITLRDLLLSLRHSSPRGSSMSKELVKLGWGHGGTSAQQEGISTLFESMMEAGSDAAYGIGEFQQRHRVDWDSVNKVPQAKL
ncbi:3-hydroxymethyl-3-methylglutaryl-CoA lyase [Colletotrichum higginsianum]|uniref:hydroxymethylglutaryl-CoA lyase n=1 Tax=Colletotrichum higginsianum (strain IMI 349063) TaxID=759273 RepID=H1V2H7_COLHI|nr:3-hydroxymethyl-3-methylglutaryl-CoA lyase [Colletotrichum higginsianum IMI 349063]OBR10200.1 3-hydroxymethyl-3-methylglutaryl-CoA lyase [Colletotrichum higginsianum IMI 349063]CCF34429.1 3-hydroxymethyl-3-methylglutaryl-CoA lyase [Colletotrichum higginsianum]